MSVRQAARTLRPGYHVELGVTPLEEVEIVDAGDVTVTPYDISEACAQIENRVRYLLDLSGHSRKVRRVHRCGRHGAVTLARPSTCEMVWATRNFGFSSHSAADGPDRTSWSTCSESWPYFGRPYETPRDTAERL
jgi:hypothetical protein